MTGRTPPDPGSRPGRSVLVVEDDEAVTGVLRIALSWAGFNVRVVTTGADALRELESDATDPHPDRRLDGLILDLTLPDGLGGEVLRAVREANSGGPAWIVVSALHRDEVTYRYGYLGSRFFPKPFDPWELAEALKRFISSRNRASR